MGSSNFIKAVLDIRAEERRRIVRWLKGEASKADRTSYYYYYSDFATGTALRTAAAKLEAHDLYSDPEGPVGSTED